MNITVALTIHTRAPLDLGKIFYRTRIRKEKYILFRSLEFTHPHATASLYKRKLLPVTEVEGGKEVGHCGCVGWQKNGVGASFNDSKKCGLLYSSLDRNLLFLLHRLYSDIRAFSTSLFLLLASKNDILFNPFFTYQPRAPVIPFKGNNNMDSPTPPNGLF